TTGSHVPLARPSHASHVPLQAALQQMPSTQNPLAQSAAALQLPPFFFLQAPAASHVFSPVHELGSSADATTSHRPVPALHEWQVVAQAARQHTPWSQIPEAQSSAATQRAPAAKTSSCSASPILLPKWADVDRPPVTSSAPLSSSVATW